MSSNDATRFQLKEVLHREVKTPEGESLGHVSDFVVQSQSGRIEFVCLAFVAPGLQGVTLIEVPWSQFRRRDNALELNVSQDALARVAGLKPV